MYSLDELEFKYDNDNISRRRIVKELYSESSSYFDYVDEYDMRTIKKKNLTITHKDTGKVLNINNIFFVSETGTFGKSKIDKVVNYLKIIELLELSLLIERISKSKVNHIWKVDLSKIDEEDVTPTMLLYRNLIKSKMSVTYDEDNNFVGMDMIKNLIDNNIVVPMEGDNLKIDTLKGEYKPLLVDIDYYWEKVYLSLGIPLHYRKSTDSKTYMSNNLLSMHDNVYAMKIRHYQLIIDKMLTFWVEKYLTLKYSDLTLKYISVNVPEFVPVSERKETDLDKSTKFVTVFSQMEQILGVSVKKEFIISKLFPNDTITDIISTDEEEIEEEIVEEEDIVSLFESLTVEKNRPQFQPFSISRTFGNKIYSKYKLKFNISINW